MGLLDRYGVNGEEQPREENAFAKRGGEVPHDKLAKWQLKTRLQKQNENT